MINYSFFYKFKIKIKFVSDYLCVIMVFIQYNVIKTININLYFKDIIVNLS